MDNKETLNREVSAWETARNRRDCKVNWQFTTQDARIKLGRLYPSIRFVDPLGRVDIQRNGLQLSHLNPRIMLDIFRKRREKHQAKACAMCVLSAKNTRKKRFVSRGANKQRKTLGRCPKPCRKRAHPLPGPIHSRKDTLNVNTPYAPPENHRTPFDLRYGP